MRNLPRTRRPGFTIVELIVAMVLFGIVMAAAMQVIVKQQRFYRGAGELLEMRTGLRQGVVTLTSDLRAIYPADGDIYDWSRSKIGFRSITGSSILCLMPTTTTIVIPPATLVQNNTLTTWLTPPVAGDSVLIYDEGREVGNDDDLWRSHKITNVATATSTNACLPTTGYTITGDATSSIQYTISPALSSTTVTGAPMRFFRRVDYGLYQASDGEWYLGASDCLPGRTPECSSYQPVSGPYRPLAGAASSGLVLTYFDSAGSSLTPGTGSRTKLARIGVIVRGETDAPFSTDQFQRDSATFIIGLRNRH